MLSGPLFVYRISATIKRAIYVDILWCFCRRFPIFFAQFFSFVKLTICMSSFHFFLVDWNLWANFHSSIILYTSNTHIRIVTEML